MKPSATQIFHSASPLACLFFLGSCLFIGFLSWALIPMHSFVDFQVDWPMLLLRSRPQIPGCDINSCLCSFQLMVSNVATSISCRDINLRNCNLQLTMSYIATSISCRDISLSLWRLQLVAFLVATSIPCRDINLCRDITMLSRHHSLSLSLILSCLPCDPCRDLHQISFNFPDVETS